MECVKDWPPHSCRSACSPGRAGKMLTEFLALSWMWFTEKEFSKRWVGAIFPLPDQPSRISFITLLASILLPTPSPYFLFTTDHQPHFSGPDPQPQPHRPVLFSVLLGSWFSQTSTLFQLCLCLLLACCWRSITCLQSTQSFFSLSDA